MRRLIGVALVSVVIFGGSLVGFADGGENEEMIDHGEKSTAYFGERSDYEPYFDFGGTKIGLMEGWWFPSYEEFLRG